MEFINQINFLIELQEWAHQNGRKAHISESNLGLSYELLHRYVAQEIIPLLLEKDITISIIELTTCGLLSDLLTCLSGASRYFIAAVIPYHTTIKIQLGLPEKLLYHGGPGTVSSVVAEKLACIVREKFNTTIGLAETGLLPSLELTKRRTKKGAGEVYVAIATRNDLISKKLFLQKDLSRLYMRQEIAFRTLMYLHCYLLYNNKSTEI